MPTGCFDSVLRLNSSTQEGEGVGAGEFMCKGSGRLTTRNPRDEIKP